MRRRCWTRCWSPSWPESRRRQHSSGPVSLDSGAPGYSQLLARIHTRPSGAKAPDSLWRANRRGRVGRTASAWRTASARYRQIAGSGLARGRCYASAPRTACGAPAVPRMAAQHPSRLPSTKHGCPAQAFRHGASESERNRIDCFFHSRTVLTSITPTPAARITVAKKRTPSSRRPARVARATTARSKVPAKAHARKASPHDRSRPARRKPLAASSPPDAGEDIARAHQRHHDRRPAAHRGGPLSRTRSRSCSRIAPSPTRQLVDGALRRARAPAGARRAAARPRRPADAHLRGIRRDVLRDRVLRRRHRADQCPLQVERARLRHRERRHRHGRHDRRRRRFRQFRRAAERRVQGPRRAAATRASSRWRARRSCATSCCSARPRRRAISPKPTSTRPPRPATRLDVHRARLRVRVRDVGLMLYTSGTTANPKGCLITHEAMVRNSIALGRHRYRLTHDDRMWSPLPMFHIAAVLPMLAIFDVGGTYLTMGYFDAGVALRDAREVQGHGPVSELRHDHAGADLPPDLPRTPTCRGSS